MDITKYKHYIYVSTRKVAGNTANYKSTFFYRPTIIPNMIPTMKGNIF